MGDIISLLDFKHPHVGDVYEIDDDVIALVVKKDFFSAHVKILNPNQVFGSKSTIVMNNNKFSEDNHIGNYEAIISDDWYF